MDQQQRLGAVWARGHFIQRGGQEWGTVTTGDERLGCLSLAHVTRGSDERLGCQRPCILG